MGDVGERKNCGGAWKIVGGSKNPWGSHFVGAVTECDIIRSITLINGFGKRSYSARGIHFPIVLLT